MDEKSRRHYNALQNILIVLLSVSAVFLFAQTQLYNLNGSASLGSLFPGSTSDFTAAPATRLTEVSAPVRMVITNSYGRYGDLQLTTTDEAFSAPGALLGTALASAAERSTCGEASFRAALDQDGIYWDFLSPLPLDILAGFAGSECTVPGTARRLLLTTGETGSAVLYLWDGENSWSRLTTGVTRAELLELTTGYEPGSASFALDSIALSPDYSTLDPYSLFLTEDMVLPVFRADNPLFDTDSLLTLLGFNPHSNYRYSDSSGATVVVENDSSVRIRPDGTVIYQSGSSDLLQISAAGDMPTAAETVVGSSALLKSLVSGLSGEADLYLTGISQNETGTQLTFGYQTAGTPIRFSDGKPAAEITLEGTSVTTFTLRFRRYTSAEDTALLLPLRQAAAIAARKEGTELSIGYADRGDESVSPGWLAD